MSGILFWAGRASVEEVANLPMSFLQYTAAWKDRTGGKNASLSVSSERLQNYSVALFDF